MVFLCSATDVSNQGWRRLWLCPNFLKCVEGKKHQRWLVQQAATGEGEEERVAGEGEQQQPHPRDVAEDQEEVQEEGVPDDIQQNDTR